MIVDVIIDEETVLTINLKSVEYLLRTTNNVDFPVKLDGRSITIQFRKTAGE